MLLFLRQSCKSYKTEQHTQMLNVRMGSYIDLSFDFRLLHVLVKALLHVKKFLVFLGQQFLHGGNRCRPENLILVFLGCLLCAVRVILT